MYGIPFIHAKGGLARAGFAAGVTVTIRKQGEMVQVFIGQAKIAEYPKAIPEALLFDGVSFDLQRQAGPNDQMFVSSIKITKG